MGKVQGARKQVVGGVTERCSWWRVARLLVEDGHAGESWGLEVAWRVGEEYGSVQENRHGHAREMKHEMVLCKLCMGKEAMQPCHARGRAK